ncbi:unnamed protein product [Adineta ricciae]|uniref:Uncharacterized protein n=1 Tax=Adineta ricciae TaxID=249248 RepID=A0A814YXM3_ADIRI|nr:unnamed protein product [Adineta ricciae]
MFIITSTTTTSSLLEHYRTRRASINDVPTNSIENRPHSTVHDFYMTNFTKTQIKVIVTVVIVIGFIMLIIVIFRFNRSASEVFKRFILSMMYTHLNACCEQDTQKIRTEIIRHRISQFSESSSHRGSIGYYTRKYTRAPSYRFDEQLNSSSTKNRSSIPIYEQLFQPKTDITISSLPIEPSTVLTPAQSHYVTTTGSNHQNESSPVKSSVQKSFSTVGISRCDDHTPLLTSDLTSTIKDSSNRATRKYSLNAFSSFIRSSNSHPLSSSSTTSFTANSKTAGDNKKNRYSLDLTTPRQINLSSVFRRNSITKQPKAFCSTIDPKNTTAQASPKTIVLPVQYDQHSTTAGNSNSSSRTSLSKIKSSNFTKVHPKKKSSTVTPTSTISPYRKDFMQKIERFRYIDDSASSTTTITSPVESTDHLNGHQPCNHLITSAIEQFDDYVRSRYYNNDEINSYIDRLNSDILTNGSYSDLNILNSTSNNHVAMPNAQVNQQATLLKPANQFSSQSETNDYRQVIRNSTPISIPSRPVQPTDNPLIRPTTIITNGHSRSMDFQSITTNNNHHLRKQELIRPHTLNNPATIYETSSSSIATLTSVRSSTSLEFDDDAKPSGVLVDDDFLPMSSPVDDHFWDMTAMLTTTNQNHQFKHKDKNECFPNVGSSPDIEDKHFDVDQMKKYSATTDQPFSETSCDEDDDDDDDRSDHQQKYSIQEYKLKELQKPIVIHRTQLNPSRHPSKPINHSQDAISISINRLSLDSRNDESLLEKFATADSDAVQMAIRSPPLRPSIINDLALASQQCPQTIFEEDDTQESSTNDNISDESADNGEIDLVHEFELSQKQEQIKSNNANLWSTNDRDIFILQEDDLLSAMVTTPMHTPAIINRPLPPSIMKMTQNKSIDSIDEQQTNASNSLKPKVRFNLDPQYEHEREWNKVNKLLGHNMEWTDEFEV